MNGIGNKDDELIHSGKIKDNHPRQSIVRAVKKSLIPMVGLVMINIVLKDYFDHEISKSTLYVIIFIITLLVSVGEWMRSRANGR